MTAIRTSGSPTCRGRSSRMNDDTVCSGASFLSRHHNEKDLRSSGASESRDQFAVGF